MVCVRIASVLLTAQKRSRVGRYPTFRNMGMSLVMVKVKSVSGQVAHTAGAFPGFRSIKRLRLLLLPPGWDSSPSQGVPPSSKFAGTHSYTWVERGTVRVKCLAREHNVAPRPGLEPRPFDSESSALTMRPARLPQLG